MRPARSLVVAVAFVMAVLAGTEQAALALDQGNASSSTEAPDQRWGSAAGRGHAVSAEATDAAAKGGHNEHRTGRGEVPLDVTAGITRLSTEAKLPEPGPVTEAQAPETATPKGFDAKGSKEIADQRKERQRTYHNPDGTYTTRFYTEPVNFRAADGKWKPIDSSLVGRDGDGPSTMSVGDEGWETRSTESRIAFAGTADAESVVSIGVPRSFRTGIQ